MEGRALSGYLLETNCETGSAGLGKRRTKKSPHVFAEAGTKKAIKGLKDAMK